MGKKVWRGVKIAFRSVLILLVAVLAFYNISMLIQRAQGKRMPTVFGYASAVVVTESMVPVLEVGDMVIIKKQQVYEVEDIVTFYDAKFGEYITHRIILIDGDSVVTKGDANNVQDNSINVSDIEGKVVKNVKHIGGFISFIQKPVGLICVLGGVFVLWILSDVISSFIKKDKKEEVNEQSKN